MERRKARSSDRKEERGDRKTPRPDGLAGHPSGVSQTPASAGAPLPSRERDEEANEGLPGADIKNTGCGALACPPKLCGGGLFVNRIGETVGACHTPGVMRGHSPSKTGVNALVTRASI